MAAHDIAYLFAICAGIVSSGLIASVWELMTREPLDRAALEEFDLLSPFRGLAYVFSRPSKLIYSGVTTAVSKPGYSLFALALGGGLSFLQGVAIMTLIFGIN